MTDLVQARAAVYALWVVAWADRTYYVLDNEVADPPGGLDGYGSPWARLVVRHTAGRPQTMGPPGRRRFRRDAIAIVNIYVPAGKAGTSLADPLVKLTQHVFEGCSIDGTTIKFNDVNPHEDGLDKSGRWWGSTVEANFDYDETR